MFFAKMFCELWHSRNSRRLIIRDTIVVFSTVLLGLLMVELIRPIPWKLLLPFAPVLCCGFLIEIIQLTIMSFHWMIQSDFLQESLVLSRPDLILAFGRYHLQSEPDWKCWEPWQTIAWLQRQKIQGPRWKIVKLQVRK